MAFDGQTLTDYGTKATFTVPTFSDTFLSRFGSVAAIISKGIYPQIGQQLNIPQSARMGRASDPLSDDSLSDSFKDLPELYAATGRYTFNYEGNATWLSKMSADDLYKQADLDRRVWELKNVNAQTDRQYISETGIQEDRLIHLSSEAAYTRSHQSTLASDQYSWEAGESVLDRAHDVTLQDDEQSHKGTEAGYARTQKATIQNDRQSFEASESVLDRASEVDLQDAEQLHRTTESGYKRSAESALASDRYLWEAAESVLDRALETDLQNDEQSHRTTENGYVRTQRSTIQDDRQWWEASESLLDRNAESSFQASELAHKTSEMGYARTQQEALQTDQLNWLTAEAILDRAAEVSLQSTSLSEKASIEAEKLDMEEQLKMLEIRLDVWKCNSNFMSNAGLGSIETWAVANDTQMFWNWQNGTLSKYNPW